MPVDPFQKPRSKVQQPRSWFQPASEMALTLITLSFLVSAVRVPDSKLATGRSAKVQLVQLCQVAHEHFLGGEDATRLEDLLSDLKGTPRRQRPPLIVDSWDCSWVIGV